MPLASAVLCTQGLGFGDVTYMDRISGSRTESDQQSRPPISFICSAPHSHHLCFCPGTAHVLFPPALQICPLSLCLRPVSLPSVSLSAIYLSAPCPSVCALSLCLPSASLPSVSMSALCPLSGCSPAHCLPYVCCPQPPSHPLTHPGCV